MTMTIDGGRVSDQELGAFLDQELPETEMQRIRDAIAVDPELGDRLVVLAAVSSLVQQQAESISREPLSLELQQLLEKMPKGAQSRRPSTWISRREQVSRFVSRHAALAAGIALLLGFYGGQLIGTNTIRATTDVGEHLALARSGQTVEIDPQTTLLARFSFLDQQSRFCRQYQLQTREAVHENVACFTDGDWRLVATAHSSAVYTALQEAEYRVASGTSLLDSTLDVMMKGDPLSLEQEAALMDAGWAP